MNSFRAYRNNVLLSCVRARIQPKSLGATFKQGNNKISSFASLWNDNASNTNSVADWISSCVLCRVKQFNANGRTAFVSVHKCERLYPHNSTIAHAHLAKENDCVGRAHIRGSICVERPRQLNFPFYSVVCLHPPSVFCNVVIYLRNHPLHAAFVLSTIIYPLLFSPSIVPSVRNAAFLSPVSKCQRNKRIHNWKLRYSRTNKKSD